MDGPVIHTLLFLSSKERAVSRGRGPFFILSLIASAGSPGECAH